MALLKFNKAELVNLEYSLKREILGSNKTGAYCNTSIIDCNTRRYHGLLAVTLDRFGGDKFLLLSTLDESLIVDGKQFNLGIHRYDNIYEPRGHKYIVDLEANPVPMLTYKVGSVVFKKSLMLAQDKDQVLVKYELLEAPSAVTLQLRPFLAFRNIHALTVQNDVAKTESLPVRNGRSWCLYDNFPSLNIQVSDSKAAFNPAPCWYNGITYSNEYRRGFDCKEDLFVPGFFQMTLKPGASVVISASIQEEDPSKLKAKFTSGMKKKLIADSPVEQLKRCADRLITDHNHRKKINAGFSWLYTGLLRETLISLPGLTLYGLDSPEQFEEILDNLIADEQDRLFRRTTQVEAPLFLASALQSYIEYGADARTVWKKYGPTVKGIIESYLPDRRAEVAMHPNGLLWAQMDNVALSWMNTYVDGHPVTERPGYQVETNAFWYNSICFALEMERKFAPRSRFIKEWTPIKELILKNFQPTFWYERGRYLADHVDGQGQHLEVRPNQICAISVKYSPVDPLLFPLILKTVDNELVTARGIRSLSPRDINYKGVYEGSQIERDLAYHHGCAHPFLLQPYIDISFRVKGAAFWKRAQWLIEGFYADLNKHGVGAFSELYDGDPPHEPHGAISSALSTSALLAVEYMLNKYKEA